MQDRSLVVSRPRKNDSCFPPPRLQHLPPEHRLAQRSDRKTSAGGGSAFPGCIAIETWQTLFTDIGQAGQIVTLQFWSWGNQEAEAMSNLNLLFQAFDRVLAQRLRCG